jgi:hypothetical protein
LRGLVAAWTRHRTRILGGDTSTRRNRERDLEASLEMSWANPLLSDSSRALLSIFSVLPSGIEHRNLPRILSCMDPVMADADDDGHDASMANFDVSIALESTTVRGAVDIAALAYHGNESYPTMLVLPPIAAYIAEHHRPDLSLIGEN